MFPTTLAASSSIRTISSLRVAGFLAALLGFLAEAAFTASVVSASLSGLVFGAVAATFLVLPLERVLTAGSSLFKVASAVAVLLPLGLATDTSSTSTTSSFGAMSSTTTAFALLAVALDVDDLAAVLLALFGAGAAFVSCTSWVAVFSVASACAAGSSEATTLVALFFKVRLGAAAFVVLSSVLVLAAIFLVRLLGVAFGVNGSGSVAGTVNSASSA